MSNNLLHIITTFFKEINKVPPQISVKSLYVNTALFCIAGSGHAVYAYGTNKKEEIIVADKYTMVLHGSTRFMIINDKGHHLNVNNSLWYWKWDSIEDWAKIKKGDHLMVTSYGIRSPLFGLFPNIVKYQ